MLVCWEIWRERNRRIFKGESRSVRQLMPLICDEASLWATAGNKGIQMLLSRHEQLEISLHHASTAAAGEVDNYVIVN